MKKIIFFLLNICLMVHLGANEVEKDNNVKELVKSNSLFALDLYHQVGKQDGNLIFSPYSISSALAMTLAGASGETESEMKSVLHLEKNEQQVQQAFAKLNGLLKSDTDEVDLKIANSLWLQKGQYFLPNFQSVVSKYFGASLEQVDFINHLDKARHSINEWARENTLGKIRDLLKPNDIDKNTRLVLVNTIYMKANWRYPFSPSRRREEPFYISKQAQVQALMMNQINQFNYLKENQYSVLELPYIYQEAEAINLAMLLLLPNEVEGLMTLEKSLTADSILSLMDKLKQTRVDVTMPKFYIRTGFELKEALKDLGMKLAFSGEADFSNMTPEKNLSLTKVIHQAFISVDENGTEAAAATAATMNLTSVHQTETPIIFKADHPFLFIIFDKNTKTILFIGRLEKP